MKKRTAVFLLFITACILLSCGKAQISAGPERPVRVMCYGDSNTYGYDPDPYEDRYPESVRWTGILQEQLGEDYQIIEEGKNGRTTGFRQDAANAFSEDGPQDLISRLENNQPVDILVIMLGTNDCRPAYDMSAEDVAAGMDALICAAEEWADQNGSECPVFVIVASPVMDGSITDTAGGSPEITEYIQKVRAAGELYKPLAESHGGIYVDARDSVELSDLDHLHLTEKGHAQLADLLAHALISLPS